MEKAKVVLIVLAVIASPATGALDFDLAISPLLDLPFGPHAANEERLYTIGAGGQLVGDFPLRNSSLFSVRGLLGFDLIDTNSLESKSLFLVTLGAGLSASVMVAPRVAVGLFVDSGYGLAVYRGAMGSSLLIQPGAEASIVVKPSFSLDFSVAYRRYVPLYSGMVITAGTSFGLGSRSKADIEIESIQIGPVFPVLHTYYNEHPLGNIQITNSGSDQITNLSVFLFVKQYMDQAKRCASVDQLGAGESVTLPLYGLFNDSILSVTEGTQAAAEIAIEYTVLDDNRRTQLAETLTIHNRNAMDWDDDRKAASFVTPRDPVILQFAKQVAGLSRAYGNRAVNQIFRQALAVFESLSVYGMNYVVDPNSSYVELSTTESALDYLQFPIQSLMYRAGDCDDLSILYAALLEAIAIDTAFVTVPGHIYIAFSLKMSPEAARKTFSEADDLIIHEGSVWIPLEVTMVQRGFLDAWKQGAKMWREYDRQGETAIFPLSTSWEYYPPVGFRQSDSLITLPEEGVLIDKYTQALTEYVMAELEPRVAELESRIQTDKEDPRLYNKLGVLYARFGLLEQAEQQFLKAASLSSSSGLINLGNLYLIQKDNKRALSMFSQAYALSPSNSRLLLGLAKTHYELGDHGAAREFYEKLKQDNPVIAERHGYLDSSTEKSERRAWDLSIRESVLWGEED